MAGGERGEECPDPVPDEWEEGLSDGCLGLVEDLREGGREGGKERE